MAKIGMTGRSKNPPKGDVTPAGTTKRTRAKAAKGGSGLGTQLREELEQAAAGQAAAAAKEKVAGAEENACNAETGALQSENIATAVAAGGAGQETETPARPAQQTGMAGKGDTKMVTLNLKGMNKRGNQAIYTGAAGTVRIATSAFPNKTAPATLTLDGELAEPRKPRSAMTPEERKAARAAQPKLTLAERVQKAEERAARLREKLAKDGAAAPAANI